MDFASWFSTKTVAPVALKLATTLAEATKDPALKKLGELKLSLQIGFDKYIRHQIDRFSKVKTILGSSVPLELRDIYVNLNLIDSGTFPTDLLTLSAREVRDDDFIYTGHDVRRTVFLATAGAGKSMLMRYLFLQTLSTNDDILPVFIELRELNAQSDKTIMQVILDNLKDRIDYFTIDHLRFALRAGLIVLFMDGFDEIDYEKRIQKLRK